MKQVIIILIGLLTIVSCTKDKVIPDLTDLKTQSFYERKDSVTLKTVNYLNGDSVVYQTVDTVDLVDAINDVANRYLKVESDFVKTNIQSLAFNDKDKMFKKTSNELKKLTKLDFQFLLNSTFNVALKNKTWKYQNKEFKLITEDNQPYLISDSTAYKVDFKSVNSFNLYIDSTNYIYIFRLKENLFADRNGNIFLPNE